MVDIQGCPPVAAPPAPNPEPAAISPDAWRRGERTTRAVLRLIQPTARSERRRAAVVDYVQRLIRCRVGSEVFPFGSVPLKTYLPDGDIDLTTSGFPNSEENLANEVRAVLESEELSKDAEFEVKDVQYIHAEVKLVKCLVQNIVVDISFNQIGGLCTLCFLEKVDEKLGKDHLFKRSIMLIKSWCYYESRILGAHHGLISTYALEILVLHIFHLFHRSLDGPLAVLYRFLDHYSKFDWDNHGVSLYGPVTLSSLPDLVACPPETQDDDLLQREEFLRECAGIFIVPPKTFENNSRVFSRKFLNIVDPLKQSNNLGRSVSKGNFYRIRSAFVFGARKLGRILQLAADSIPDEVNMFFKNTLERHGSGERPDVQDALGSPNGLVSKQTTDDPCLNVEKADTHSSPLLSPYSNSYEDLSDQFNKISISNSYNHEMLTQREENPLAEDNERMSVSCRCSAGDATDTVPTQSISTSNKDDISKAYPSASDKCTLPSGKPYCAPHHYYQSENNGAKDDVKDDTIPSESDTITKGPADKFCHSFEDIRYDNKLPENSTTLLRHHAYFSSASSIDGLSTSSSNNFPPEGSHLVDNHLIPRIETHSNGVPSKEVDHDGATSKDSLPDLTGDYNTNFNNLFYAQGCYQEYPMGQIYYQIPSPPPAQYQSKHLWNGYNRKNMYRFAGSNGMVPGPHYSPGYFVVRPIYQTDDSMRARGTGTYFPNTNLRKDRPASGRGERGNNKFPPNKHQRFRNAGRADMSAGNAGRADMPADSMPSEEFRQEPPMQIYVPSGNDHGIPSPLKISSPSSQAPRGVVHGNGFMQLQQSKPEFGTLGPMPLEVSSQDHATRSDSASHSQASGSASPMSPAQKPGMSSNRRRNTQPYHLKDDDDFPPLSS